MSDAKVTWAVFTKPWTVPLPELGRLVSGMGFNGIELPAREGYPVNPENLTKMLPEAVKILGDHGVKICSVTGPATEEAITAYGAAGIPILRVMVPDLADYRATEAAARKDYDRMLPMLERHNVKVGVQNHSGGYICNATTLLHLIEGYDPERIGAVLCVGHCALNGEPITKAIDIIWPHLAMVFFKNAFWRRTNGPEAEVASWGPHWTAGRHGLQSWPTVAAELKKRGYRGVINLNAEYSDMSMVNRLATEDLQFAKSLFQ